MANENDDLTIDPEEIGGDVELPDLIEDGDEGVPRENEGEAEVDGAEVDESELTLEMQAALALADTNPKLSQELLDAIEAKANTPPAKIEAIPGSALPTDEVERIKLEHAEIGDIYTKFEKAERETEKTARAAYASYEASKGKIGAYEKRCAEAAVDPDPDVIDTFRDNVRANAEKYNELYGQLQESIGGKNFLHIMHREMTAYPEFARFPALYVAMRHNGALSDNMRVSERKAALIAEATKQGLIKPAASEKTTAKPKYTSAQAKLAIERINRLKKSSGGGATRQTGKKVADKAKNSPSIMGEYLKAM